MIHNYIIDKTNESFGYFAWPSVAKLPSGSYAMVCSGYRLNHVCPFGRVVISYSKDGKQWTSPVTILDTPLDDRDAGITVFGRKVLVTSFTNTRSFQKRAIEWYNYTEEEKASVNSKIDSVSDEDEDKYLGPIAAISYDGGDTYSLPYRIPVTAPHGPTVLKDETLLMVGTTIENGNMHCKVMSYKSVDGINWYSGVVLEVPKYIDGKEVLFCEPHTVQANSGRLVELFVMY